MNDRELDYIICIAKHQNITKAAEELYISQPALSKALQNIEKISEVKLFSRIGKKIVLTYAGERYIHYARQIKIILNDLNVELSDISKSNRGRIRIAFPMIRGSYMIPDTLPLFMKKHPNVDVILHEQPSQILENLLLNDEADIALFNHPIIDRALDYEVLSNEEITLAVSKDNPISKKGVQRIGCKYPWIDLKDLENEKFILHKPDQRTGQIGRQLLSNAKISPEVILETRSIEGAVRLAASNFGVCFVCETHLNHIHLKDKPVCFSVGEPNTTVQLVVAYRKGIYLPKYTQEYIQIVRDCL